MKRILVLLALTAAGLRAELQFSGFFITANESLFTLSDKDGAEMSGWLKIGESFHSYTIKSFDREHEVITVEKGGQTFRLGLRESKVKDGKMTIDGTITLWPGKREQSVHASLFLGEEEVLPLKEGVYLHLTAERLLDGNMLYHPRIVMQDKDGRESSDSWPNVVTPPGGEFSIRVGDLGFSFKP
jgi:hypothetical protein